MPPVFIAAVLFLAYVLWSGLKKDKQERESNNARCAWIQSELDAWKAHL